MIIVSQDKMRTTESLNLEIIKYETETVEFPNIKTITSFQISDTNVKPLGVYKSKERAKEVLQEIIITYSDFEYYKNASEEEREETNRLMKAKYKHFDTYIMPEE